MLELSKNLEFLESFGTKIYFYTKINVKNKKSINFAT